MATMNKRELGFLLIGFGTGLLLAVAIVLEFILWFHHVFILGFTWQAGSLLLAVPFVLIAVGIAFLKRRPRAASDARGG